MGLFNKHIHKWKLLSEVTSKSPVEVAVECGLSLTKGSVSMFDRTIVQIVTCSECGAIKKFVTNI